MAEPRRKPLEPPDPAVLAELKIRALFRVWQQQLGLDGWVIRVDFEAFEPATTTMQITRSHLYDRARVQVNNWVLTGKPPPEWEGREKGTITDLDTEEAVCHELLHAALNPMRRWTRLLDGECHRDAYDVAVEGYAEDEEAVIDKLARALVKAWPR
jgi:hypothetical protein